MSLQYDKFLLFGDSITQYANDQTHGFVLQPALQNLYIRKLDIINRGYAGYNSEHARLIFPEILKIEKNIKLVTIFFGTNDAKDYVNDIQTVELDRYVENIGYLIELAHQHNIKVIVIGPGLHDPKLAKETWRKLGRFVDKDISSNKRQWEYSEAAKKVATQYNVPFVDLWNALRESQGWSQEQVFDGEKGVGSLGHLLHDGVHFTGVAYKVLYDKIVETIDGEYPELSAGNLPLKLAEWVNIDPKNLSSSIFT
ncbi:hypothetical protein G210_0109 [Candida maltosa Xu316]|uniref:SGNH hydrolase-type esterase domain-containing protein n=1 Tax=Candida maltosa (strain Xu316) TaxID=1245528 RepID=M3HP03_CANMX|nr:hypothetical protein G210_0109 [Candida maltosa Xu316]